MAKQISSLFTMLIGTELLAKVKELGDASKSDLVRSAGYVSTKKDGTERLNFTATKIQFNGNLLVGKAYTAQLGLKPGDEFEIKLGRKQIQLIPLGEAEEE
jgi:hypothetical protein